MKKSIILLAMLSMGIMANAQTKTDSTMTKISDLESIASGVKNGYILIENGVVKGYKTVESDVVTGYKAMEKGIVNGFTSVSDAITLKIFGKDGETLEQTKARLNANAEASKQRGKKTEKEK